MRTDNLDRKHIHSTPEIMQWRELADPWAFPGNGP
jgi:hypothetical protein